MTEANGRKADHPIDPLFLERWSPRSFADETLAEADLLTMLEAARWAASAYNSQPWRFVWARRGTPHWENVLGVLVPFNQSWAKSAAALVVIVSKETMRAPGADKDVPSSTHSLDAGAAAGNLALQAGRMGWHVHGMSGFDRERAVATLKVPAGHTVEAVYAIGRLGDPAHLPEKLREREMPSARLPLTELAFEGAFVEA